MLHELERKLTALVGDGLLARGHLRVVQAPGVIEPLDPGEGSVRVAVTDVAPLVGFERSHIGAEGTAAAPTTRRVLPLRFHARLGFAVRSGASPDDLSASRSLLLEDISLAGHLLAAPAVRHGSAFRVAGTDAGFEVHCFELEPSAVEPAVEAATLRGELVYAGEASIWPPVAATPEGVIRRPDPAITPLPIRIAVESPAVRAGTTTLLRIGEVGTRRLADASTGARTAAALALRVLSDLPTAQRGRVLSGVDGSEAGVRIVPLTTPETVVEYRAPTGDLGATRLELVAVHLATPDGRSGILLGSATVELVPETP